MGSTAGSGLSSSVCRRGEMSVVIVEAIGMVEAVFQWLAVDVPFARVIGAIAERLEHLGQKSCPLRPDALATALHTGDRVSANLLGIVAGQDRRPRRPATSRVVELREPKAVLRECVEVGGRDLAAVAAGIRETHVVREDEQHIRPGGLGGN